jgi:hypothetical protein
MDLFSFVLTNGRGRGRGNKRIMSDSEDEVDDVRPAVLISSESPGHQWLEKRDPRVMSAAELSMNQAEARRQASGLIRKKPRASANGQPARAVVVDHHEDEDRVISTMNPQLNDVLQFRRDGGDFEDRRPQPKNFNAVHPKVEPAAQRLKKIAEREKRVQYVRSSSSSSSSEASNGSDSDEASGRSEDEWHDDAKYEAHVRAKVGRVIGRCAELSTRLKNTIDGWRGAAPLRNSCVDLTAIDTETAGDTSMHILTAADMDVCCPGLILKPYQLVGVNWIRLLHSSDMNGVLADDMVTTMRLVHLSFLRLVFLTIIYSTGLGQNGSDDCLSGLAAEARVLGGPARAAPGRSARLDAVQLAE